MRMHVCKGPRAPRPKDFAERSWAWCRLEMGRSWSLGVVKIWKDLRWGSRFFFRGGPRRVEWGAGLGVQERFGGCLVQSVVWWRGLRVWLSRPSPSIRIQATLANPHASLDMSLMHHNLLYTVQSISFPYTYLLESHIYRHETISEQSKNRFIT